MRPTHGITSADAVAHGSPLHVLYSRGTPKAELADGLATSVFVMGIETGLDRINQIPSVDCIIIDDQGGIHKSAHIEIENL